MRQSILVLGLLLAACDSSGNNPAHQYPGMDSAEFQVFGNQCSVCHAPPLPSQHRAQEWPMVVNRMMQHRAERGLPPVAPKEQMLILQYVQRYSAEPA